METTKATFTSLPTEILIKIWTYAMEPRDIHLNTTRTGTTLVQGTVSAHRSSKTDEGQPINFRLPNLRCITRPPALFGINQISCEIGLELYKVWDLRYYDTLEAPSQHVYIDPECDTIVCSIDDTSKAAISKTHPISGKPLKDQVPIDKQVYVVNVQLPVEVILSCRTFPWVAGEAGFNYRWACIVKIFKKRTRSCLELDVGHWCSFLARIRRPADVDG